MLEIKKKIGCVRIKIIGILELIFDRKIEITSHNDGYKINFEIISKEKRLKIMWSVPIDYVLTNNEDLLVIEIVQYFLIKYEEVRGNFRNRWVYSRNGRKTRERKDDYIKQGWAHMECTISAEDLIALMQGKEIGLDNFGEEYTVSIKLEEIK